LSRRWNPVVRVRVGGRRLAMPWAHALPFHLARYPHYDAVLPRLAAALMAREPGLRVIDVGANIGDTASLLRERGPMPILAIEADEEYFGLLLRNTHDLPGVTGVRALLSEADAAAGDTTAALTKSAGTAHVKAGGGVTLDTLLRTHPEFARAGLLKIDTDGFDLRVLRGAARLLAEATPVVFFECSPRHWEMHGGSAPRDVFPLLRAAGYGTVAYYDNEGWLVGAEQTAEPRLCGALCDYARAKGHYHDVLAFPARHDGFADEFLAAERRHFTAAPAR
jgi:FkbM family methyltransferase